MQGNREGGSLLAGQDSGSPDRLEFIERVARPMLALEGDRLPVSAFAPSRSSRGGSSGSPGCLKGGGLGFKSRFKYRVAREVTGRHPQERPYIAILNCKSRPQIRCIPPPVMSCHAFRGLHPSGHHPPSINVLQGPLYRRASRPLSVGPSPPPYPPGYPTPAPSATSVPSSARMLPSGPSSPRARS